MPSSDEKLFAATAAELSRLQEEIRALLAARWALVRFEAAAAFSHIKSLVVAFAVSGVLILSSLPVLVVAAADALAGTYDIGRTGWLLIGFATLIVSAALIAAAAYVLFRRRFVGFEETFEVLREDQAWIESLTRGRKK